MYEVHTLSFGSSLVGWEDGYCGRRIGSGSVSGGILALAVV